MPYGYGHGFMGGFGMIFWLFIIIAVIMGVFMVFRKRDDVSATARSEKPLWISLRSVMQKGKYPKRSLRK